MLEWGNMPWRKKRYFRCGYDEKWTQIKFRFGRAFYDKKFWSAQIGPFWAIWSLNGLPRIFDEVRWEKED